jgi:glycosyltransferase involved in cell wall biosynthesis
MTLPKISIIYTTARRDCPMLGRPLDHQFDVFLDSIKRQSFKDFEVIIVDLLKDKAIEKPTAPEFNKINARNYDFNKYNFPIKHIAPKSTWWLDRQFASYCHCVNTGIIAADGELIVLFDDCSEILGNDSLELHWDWYKKGDGKTFARSIFEYWHSGRPWIYGEPGAPFVEKLIRKPVRHSMYDYLIQHNQIHFTTNNICAFGYYSFSLQTMLDLNGYNELFDGVKGAEDFDMGCRLIDYGCQEVNDIRLRVIENVHEPFVFHMANSNWRWQRSNLGLHLTLLKRGRGIEFTKANDRPLTQAEYNDLVKYHIENMAGWKETDEFRRLLTDPPIFDLKQLRKEYRDGLCTTKQVP